MELVKLFKKQQELLYKEKAVMKQIEKDMLNEIEQHINDHNDCSCFYYSGKQYLFRDIRCNVFSQTESIIMCQILFITDDYYDLPKNKNKALTRVIDEFKETGYVPECKYKELLWFKDKITFELEDDFFKNKFELKEKRINIF